jgi:hypothetical protein
MQSLEFKKYEQVLDYLCCDEMHFNVQIDKKLIQDVLVHPRKEVLEVFRSCLKKKLVDEEALRINPHYAYGLISLIPYTYPEEGEEFKLPVFNEENDLTIVDVRVSKVMNATIDRHLSPLKAYALSGENKENFLVFTGTTFPAASGFLNSLIADFTPFSSVGKLPFKIFKKELTAFFTDKKNVHVYGMSLGGALGLHALRDFHQKISHVFAQVPAGLHFYDRYDPSMKTKVTIITHKNDIVSKLGFFPEHKECEFFQVKEDDSSGVKAHAKLLVNHQAATIRKIDPKLENRSIIRRIITSVHFVFSILVFIPLFLCYLFYKIYKISEVFLQSITNHFQKRTLEVLPH